MIRFDTHYGGCESSATGGSDCPTVIVTGTPPLPPLPGVGGGSWFNLGPPGNVGGIPLAGGLATGGFAQAYHARPAAAAGAQLQTGEDILQGLLDQGLTSTYHPPASELEKLLGKDLAPPSELDKLLGKSFVPSGGAVSRIPGWLLALGPIGDFLALLLTPTEAGISASEEAKRVSESLIPVGPPGIRSNTGKGDQGGYPASPISFPFVEGTPPAVVVTGTPNRAPAPLEPFPFESPDFHPWGLLPDVGTATGPRGTPRRLTQPQPQPRPQPETRADFGPLAPSANPLTQPGPQQLHKPETATRASAQDCNCNKPGKSKKQRKKRTICHKGEYVELANGLLKYKREEIPCR